MNWIGRGIGLLLGAIFWHLPGAIIGFAVGYYFDRGLANFKLHSSPEMRQKMEMTLFKTVFPLLGKMAKADGRVSEEEIDAAEIMMSRMQLSSELRQEAIKLFQQGAQPDFDLDLVLAGFMAACGQYSDIKQLLLVYLITMAMSDGHIDESEVAILREVSRSLGYSADAFEHILGMAQAQGFFHQGQAGGAPSQAATLTMAYQALGVSEDVTDAELKRAYRKLMSQYHPDKLIGQGVPDEMVNVATERSQEIQAAYDLIKKHRK